MDHEHAQDLRHALHSLVFGDGDMQEAVDCVYDAVVTHRALLTTVERQEAHVASATALCKVSSRCPKRRRAHVVQRLLDCTQERLEPEQQVDVWRSAVKCGASSWVLAVDRFRCRGLMDLLEMLLFTLRHAPGALASDANRLFVMGIWDIAGALDAAYSRIFVSALLQRVLDVKCALHDVLGVVTGLCGRRLHEVDSTNFWGMWHSLHDFIHHPNMNRSHVGLSHAVACCLYPFVTRGLRALEYKWKNPFQLYCLPSMLRVVAWVGREACKAVPPLTPYVLQKCSLLVRSYAQNLHDNGEGLLDVLTDLANVPFSGTTHRRPHCAALAKAVDRLVDCVAKPLHIVPSATAVQALPGFTSRVLQVTSRLLTALQPALAYDRQLVYFDFQSVESLFTLALQVCACHERHALHADALLCIVRLHELSPRQHQAWGHEKDQRHLYTLLRLAKDALVHRRAKPSAEVAPAAVVRWVQGMITVGDARVTAAVAHDVALYFARYMQNDIVQRTSSSPAPSAALGPLPDLLRCAAALVPLCGPSSVQQDLLGHLVAMAQLGYGLPALTLASQAAPSWMVAMCVAPNIGALLHAVRDVSRLGGHVVDLVLLTREDAAATAYDTAKALLFRAAAECGHVVAEAAMTVFAAVHDSRQAMETRWSCARAAWAGCVVRGAALLKARGPHRKGTGRTRVRV